MEKGEEIKGGLLVGKFENNYIIIAPAAVGEIEDTWENALNFCTNLVIGEFNDWALPTKEELLFVCKQLADFSDAYTFKDGYYWSSTTDHEIETCAIAQALYAKIAGYQVSYNKSNVYNARAIRKIPV